MQRITIIGTTGSGKSTLARRLAQHLALPYLDADALIWQPGWIEAPVDEIRAHLDPLTSRDNWIYNGIHWKLADLTWQRADIVIFLDYFPPLIFWRLFKHSVRRILENELVCNGNTETWRKTFFSRSSVILWAIRTHYSRRARYLALMADPAYKHVTFIHLRSPKETETWLAALPCP